MENVSVVVSVALLLISLNVLLISFLCSQIFKEIRQLNFKLDIFFSMLVEVLHKFLTEEYKFFIILTFVLFKHQHSLFLAK